ncbi:redoxin domain-containing protein [uncultured Mucilaginibacter sp.]|uniref:redoxin domain-containing protein n=1 Tax=uncultured Mucilaginibacter sp. TaxID=797541 RepID=UPI0025E66BED|nr:redoxin domain-containing protein [uncultured Mucilaginibacter sp.]
MDYPQFDVLEITPELEYNTNKYHKLEPVKTGETVKHGLPVPVIGALNNFCKAKALPKLSKILVVYFYSKHWGDVGLDHLKQLNAIRNETKFYDGKIVVVDADGDEDGLQQLLWLHNISLPIHSDTNGAIAGLFGVFSEHSPTWNFYGGIDVNIPLPATYVVDHDFKVAFSYPNENISNTIPVNEVVDAVYRSNNYLAGRRSA